MPENYLTEAETYTADIYQIETTDQVIGGADGLSNRQAKELANRTNWLKAKVDTWLAWIADPSIAWSKITGKPATYPPSTHNHDAAYAPLEHNHDASYAAAGHNHDAAYAPLEHNHDEEYAAAEHGHGWDDISDKPAAYPPSEHGHAWGEIVDKPAEYPPSQHSHQEADLPSATTSGKGVVELATEAEGKSLTSGDRALTPGVLGKIIASVTQYGLSKLASNSQAVGGSHTGVAMTPKNVRDLIRELDKQRHKVGCLYFSMDNPASFLGFGTWVEVNGRFVVGRDPGDSDFNSVGETGGSKSHKHSTEVSRDNWGSDTLPDSNSNPTVDGRLIVGSGLASGQDTNWRLLAEAQWSKDFDSNSKEHLPPYIVTKIWRRTA